MSFATKNNTTGISYVLITALAVLLTWELHELAHWTVGTGLGYNMVMTLNTGYSLESVTEVHYQLISAVGPIVTLLQAILIFLVMRRRNVRALYPFLFSCFYCRLFAAVISFLKLNDEARISKYLGIGTFTLPLIVSAILFFLVYRTSRRYGFSLKFNVINLGLVIFFSSVIILSDQFFHIRLL